MNSSIDGTKDETILQKKLLLQPLKKSSNENIDTKNLVETFSSQNLVMKPIEENDKALYKDIFSDPDITKYTGGVLNEDQLTLCFTKSISELRVTPIGYITWVVQIKESKESIGILNLILHHDAMSSAEFGIMFTKAFHNKGFCCELLERFIKFCFTEMNIASLFSFTMDDNKPVSHILHKLDFEKQRVSPFEKPSVHGSYWGIYKD